MAFIDNHKPKHIAEKINNILNNPKKLDRWKENLKFAATKLCWENEEKVLMEVYKSYV